MKLKNKIFFLFLFVITQSAFAQSGFIGKKHEVSFDLYNSIFKGQYDLNYKYSFSKHSSLLLNASLVKSKVIARDWNPQLKVNILDNIQPNASCSGAKAGIGILWHSKTSNLNMPVGYYTGFSLEYYKGSLINTIPAGRVREDVQTIKDSGVYMLYNTTPHTNKYDLIFPFKVNGCNMNFFFGKNIYLLKNITLDLSLRLGLAYYSFKPTNFATNFPDVDINRTNDLWPAHVGTTYGGYILYDDKEDIYYIKNSFFLMPDMTPRILGIEGHVTPLSSYHLLFTNNQYYENGGSKYIATPVFHKMFLIYIAQIKIGYLF
ncbi:MAG: hypothetical protein RI955_2006 [Bacteroidota bacterium]